MLKLSAEKQTNKRTGQKQYATDHLICVHKKHNILYDLVPIKLLHQKKQNFTRNNGVPKWKKNEI